LQVQVGLKLDECFQGNVECDDVRRHSPNTVTMVPPKYSMNSQKLQ